MFIYNLYSFFWLLESGLVEIVLESKILLIPF